MITRLSTAVRRRGIGDVAKMATTRVFHTMRGLVAPRYKGPTEKEHAVVEKELAALGASIRDYLVEPEKLAAFNAAISFPDKYHGGSQGGVFEEKQLEHYVAWDILGLNFGSGARYIDIAGASSPWAAILSTKGVDAYCIDLAGSRDYQDHGNYLQGDATDTQFPDEYFDGASAQCAFEMFQGDSDIALLTEAYRILKPGGKLVISPLYMHTHHCYYQSPDFWGKKYGDKGAKAYIRHGSWGIPASRKYAPKTLMTRIIQTATNLGLESQILVLRNKEQIPGNIYLHFILVLSKPLSTS